MTQQEALTLMAQVKSEVPEIITRLINSRPNSANGYQVKLEYAGRIVTAYKPKHWQEIKWAWGLEDVAPPSKYLVDGIPMKIECIKGYWYGRYQIAGQTVRRYLGKVDPRPVLDVYKKEEEVAI